MLPDIISFNEVSPTFHQMISSTKWVQENYWMSEYTPLKERGFCNLLLSKIKPLCFDKIYIKDL